MYVNVHILVTPFMKEIEEANKGHSGVPNKLLRLTTYPRCRLYNDRALRWNLQIFLGMHFVSPPISADITQ